MADEILKVGQ